MCNEHFNSKQQEPRLTASMCDDEHMIKNYEDDKDLYATLASMVTKKPYEHCLEFFPKGTEIYEIKEGVFDFASKDTPMDKIVVAGHKTHTYKEGKNLRKKFKALLLGRPYSLCPAC